MLAAKKLYWFAQMAGWGAYAMLILLATYANDPSKINKSLLLSIIVLVVSGVLFTHSMRWVYIKFNWFKTKFNVLIYKVLLLSALTATLMSISNGFFDYLIDPKEVFKIDWLDTIIDGFALSILILFWNTIYFTFHYFQKSRKQELDNMTLEASKNEIELKTLKSQLNPHFLFNALNSIRALIEINPDKAKTSITVLSNLLRQSLLTGKENTISFQEELELVSNYLMLEKIRFEERLNVDYKIDENTFDLPIPPFSLQLLVENAIKHGISKLIDGGDIEIKSSIINGYWVIEVINSGQYEPKENSGIGISNTERRLKIQFKNKANFLVLQKEDKVVAQLIFEL